MPRLNIVSRRPSLYIDHYKQALLGNWFSDGVWQAMLVSIVGDWGLLVITTNYELEKKGSYKKCIYGLEVIFRRSISKFEEP